MDNWEEELTFQLMRNQIVWAKVILKHIEQATDREDWLMVARLSTNLSKHWLTNAQSALKKAKEQV
jgi:hypothetical protein